MKASTKSKAESKLREVERVLQEAVGEAARNRDLQAEGRREKGVKVQGAVGRVRSARLLVHCGGSRVLRHRARHPLGSRHQDLKAEVAKRLDCRDVRRGQGRHDIGQPPMGEGLVADR